MSEDTKERNLATIRLGPRRRPERPSTARRERESWKTLMDDVRLRIRRWRVCPDELEPGRWWNGSLRSRDQLSTAARRARAASLPLTGERDRNWDALEALELILAETDPSARIADIGLEDYDPLLEWLRILGYGRIQPEVGVRAEANRILAVGGGESDETGAAPPGTAGHYDVVTCRSLPGDRIALPDRLDQAAHLLRSGGIFVLSTEFWDMPPPYQGGEQRCARDHLCCRPSADRLSREALDRGLVPVAPVFLGESPEGLHPDLLGVGVSPVKLAFRKREEAGSA